MLRPSVWTMVWETCFKQKVPTGCWESHVDKASRGTPLFYSGSSGERQTSDGSSGGVCREEERKASENWPIGEKKKEKDKETRCGLWRTLRFPLPEGLWFAIDCLLPFICFLAEVRKKIFFFFCKVNTLHNSSWVKEEQGCYRWFRTVTGRNGT